MSCFLQSSLHNLSLSVVPTVSLHPHKFLQSAQGRQYSTNFSVIQVVSESQTNQQASQLVCQRCSQPVNQLFIQLISQPTCQTTSQQVNWSFIYSLIHQTVSEQIRKPVNQSNIRLVIQSVSQPCGQLIREPISQSVRLWLLLIVDSTQRNALAHLF